jgi:predicted nucleic-acid-binding Zn-ribbon protein
MTASQDCPHCGNTLFVTKSMTLNWFQVFLALIVSCIVFYVLKAVLVADVWNGNAKSGRFLACIILGTIGLVGLIFAKGVNKRRFLVSSCTRCDYVDKQEISELQEDGK